MYNSEFKELLDAGEKDRTIYDGLLHTSLGELCQEEAEQRYRCDLEK